MLVGAVLLLAFYVGADWLVARFHLPLSGPVLGMALLTVALALRGRTPRGLSRVSDLLLRAMPLFFIPAGVGVMVLSDQLRTAWLPIGAALLGSTLLAMATTAIVMKTVAKRLARFPREAPAMSFWWTTPLPGVLGTILAYALCVRLQRRARGRALANPVATAILLLVALLALAKLPYSTYFASARLLHFLLGPATVALAVPLARELPRLRRLLWPVGAGLLAGNLAAAGSAIFLAKVLGANRQVTLSLAPKSVTTPIAMGISERIGGLPSLTAVLVITTGVIGAVLGPWFLDRLGIDDPTVRGTAMGVSSHGLGTAAIYQESSEAGAFSGLAMGLSGLITALTLPVLVAMLGI